MSGTRAAKARAGFTLARLAFVRTAPLTALVALAFVLGAARWHELARVAVANADASGTAAAARAACWTLALVLGVPFFVARAARTFARWRRGELDFLAPRAAAPAFVVGASWCGTIAAFVVLGVVAALAAEAGVRDAPALRASGSITFDTGAWITGARSWSANVDLPAQPEGTRLALALVLGSGGGPATEVVLDAARASANGGAITTRSASVRLGTRGELEVVLPPGDGELTLGVRVTDPSARVYLVPQTARLWQPVAGARDASFALCARLVLLGALASALALGCGAFMAPHVASALVLALWLVPDVFGAEPAWIPARDLFDALDIAARGRVPAWPPWVAVFGTLALSLVCLAPCAFNRAVWRRTR